MSYVLSVIHPPKNGAAYGRADSFLPVGMLGVVATIIAARLTPPDIDSDPDVNAFAVTVIGQPLGTEMTYAEKGLTFRIDPMTNAPHPCPCCRRTVLPADLEGALCGGCYTFDDTEQCLPENTAHPTEES
jgi:hypothetical protein